MSDYLSASTEYFIHISVGERWDQIADKYYGVATLYEPIIRANPLLPITTVVPEGTRVKIPILNADDLTDDEKGDIPPWE